MKMVVLPLMALLYFPSAGEQIDSKQELKLLEGTWRVLALEVDGKVQPAEKSPKEIIIAGNKLTGIGPDMTMKLDPTKKPKWVDLAFKKMDKAYPIRAIYEIKGDNLKICMPLAPKGKSFDNKRPGGFDTAGKAVALFIAKRASK
jgi:uncharacterized protein (TIGR03067 family)